MFVGVWVRTQNKHDFENDRWLFGICYRSNFPAGFQDESPKDCKVNWTYSVVVWESSEEAPLEPPLNTGSVRDRLTPLVSASLVHRLDTRTRAVLRGNQLHCTEQLPPQMHKICGPPCTKPIPLFTTGFFVFLSEWKTCMNNKPLECRALPPWDNSDGVHSSEVFEPVGRYGLTPCLRPFISTLTYSSSTGCFFRDMFGDEWGIEGMKGTVWEEKRERELWMVIRLVLIHLCVCVHVSKQAVPNISTGRDRRSGLYH